MRIEGPGRVGTSGQAKARGSASSGFRLPDMEERTPTSQTSSVMGSPGLDALLALQSVDEATERRRKAVARGRNLLDALDKMKLALIEGDPSEASLLALQSAISREKAQTDDTGLDDILSAIDLRAQVEIAKRMSRSG